MNAYVTLLGAEDIARASATMSQAAEAMQRAASQFDFTAERLIRYLDEFASRLEALKEERS